MSVDRRELRHLAALAGLELEPGEEEALARDLARMVEYVEVIGTVEEAPPPPAPAPREVADRPRTPLPRERVMADAPEAEEGRVRVPPLRPREDGDG